MNTATVLPEALQKAWLDMGWKSQRAAWDANRTPVLPELRAIVARFVNSESALSQFVSESQQFAFAKPYWGFKAFGQMQLNQYVKVSQAVGLEPETTTVLRAALIAPGSDSAARRSLSEVVAITETLRERADRASGPSKPAVGRVPFVVSYFWEAQDRDRWPIAYPSGRGVLSAHGLYPAVTDPVDSYMSYRAAILALAQTLGGDAWDIEALLFSLKAKKKGAPNPQLGDPRVWIVRAGERGIYEELALSESAAVIGWSELGPLSTDLSRDDLKAMIQAQWGEDRPASLTQQAGQIYRFINEIAIGDIVVLPLLAHKGNVAVGQVTGDYVHRTDGAFANADAKHTRPVEWLATSVPYERFDAELRESFGQQGTVSRIDQKDVVERILAVLEGASAAAIHLVLKWSATIDPQTIDKHRSVAEVHGSAWWGRLGKEGSTGLADRWVKKLNEQLQSGTDTYVFLHSPTATWQTRLLAISVDPPTETELIPAYYDSAAHHTLWAKLADFARSDPGQITGSYVLAQSGAPVTAGGLGNQTPLIIRAKSAVIGPGKKPSVEFSPDSVQASAEALGLVLHPELYHQLVAALESGKHVILTGPPGTAKTTLAQAVAQTARHSGRSADYVLTTATSDWTTFETIGGLRPTPSGELEFKEGHFLQAIRSNGWLVIDELNRSNFDRAFGQLFTVLSGQAVVLPYERSGLHPPRPLVLVPDGAESPIKDGDVLGIPQSWRVIATMNVFDKSLLFEMSFALMRRFAFIEVPSPSPAVFEALIERETGGDNDAAELAKKLLVVRNPKLKDLGPAMFMDLARFLRERLALDPTADPGQLIFEAFYSYLLPQFEGVDDAGGEFLFKSVGKLVGGARKERLRQTLNSVLGLELRPPKPLEEEEVEEEAEEEDEEDTDVADEVEEAQDEDDQAL